MQAGEYMEVVTVGGRKVFRCVCGYEFGPIAENWKNSAVKLVVSADAAGSVKLHKDLEMRVYYCPECAVQHSVEIALKEAPMLWEIEPKVW